MRRENKNCTLKGAAEGGRKGSRSNRKREGGTAVRKSGPVDVLRKRNQTGPGDQQTLTEREDGAQLNGLLTSEKRERKSSVRKEVTVVQQQSTIPPRPLG